MSALSAARAATVAIPADEAAEDLAAIRAAVERIERELAPVAADYRELTEVAPGDTLRPGWHRAMIRRLALMEQLRGRDYLTLRDGKRRRRHGLDPDSPVLRRERAYDALVLARDDRRRRQERRP